MALVERLAPCGAPTRTPATRPMMPSRGTPWRRLWLVAGIVLFTFGGATFGAGNLDIANLVFIGVLGSVALNLLMGVAGQVSVGNAALMAVGAFTAAPLAIDYGLPMPVVVVLAALATGLVGLFVGIPSLRLRGLYLVIATLALHFIVLYIVERYQGEETGAAGFIMPIATLGGWEIEDADEWYYVLGVAAIFSMLLVNGLLRSKYGRASARHSGPRRSGRDPRREHLGREAPCLRDLVDHHWRAGRTLRVLHRRRRVEHVLVQPGSSVPRHGDHRWCWVAARLGPRCHLRPGIALRRHRRRRPRCPHRCPGPPSSTTTSSRCRACCTG